MPTFLERFTKAKRFLVFVLLFSNLCWNTEQRPDTYIGVLHNLALISLFHNQIKGYLQRDYVKRFNAAASDPGAIRALKKFPRVVGIILAIAETNIAFIVYLIAYHYFYPDRRGLSCSYPI